MRESPLKPGTTVPLSGLNAPTQLIWHGVTGTSSKTIIASYADATDLGLHDRVD
jgi:hypothetical protein